MPQADDIEGNKRVFFFWKWQIKMKKRGESGPAVKLLKRRLDYDGLLFFLTFQLNRDKHKSLVFVPFQNSLLGLVFLLVPNSEYTMTLQVDFLGVAPDRLRDTLNSCPRSSCISPHFFFDHFW